MQEPTMIAAHNAAAQQLGEPQPKESALVPGLTESDLVLWQQEGAASGVWECTPGQFASTREGYTEVCIILSGSVTVTPTGGEGTLFKAGDVMITPNGWTGTWDVHEALRKHYTLVAA